MTDTNDSAHSKAGTDSDEQAVEGIQVRRRAVMKAAGAAGVIGGGFAGVAGADEVDTCEEATLTGEETCDDCHKHCNSCAQQGSCTVAVDSDCEEITGSRVNVGGEKHCHEVAAEDIPNDATTAVIKAANDCWVCEVIDPTTDQTFCIDGKHAISHIEFARCPDATISADCPNDRARIDVDLTNSVYFEVSYRDCDGDLDEPSSGRLTFEDDAAGGTGDDWHTFVALADCEGTITVWNAESKETKFDTTEFDCESGTVDADCEADAITVFAEDTTDLWYEIDFVDCEAEDVDRTSVSGLDSADTVTVLEPIPNCRGTVTLFED